MKLVIAYFRPEHLNAVKQALYAKGLHGMSVTNIAGSGRQKGYTEQYRGGHHRGEPAQKSPTRSGRG
jgi:nitrogen regulatory protein P-II 1